MILRSLMKHVRDQNWTAVGLDFVIVVVGVFIGIQVSNWNEARAFDKVELSYLGQLKDEVEQNRRVTEYQIAYVQGVVEAGNRALNFLESGQGCTADCTEVLIDFFHASQVWGTPRTVTIFTEMERLGLPRDPDTRSALKKLYRFLDGWDFVNLSPPAYRENVRGYFSPEASDALWRDCYDIPDDELEALTYGCVDRIPEQDAVRMLDQILTSPDLANQLRFWIGQNLFAMGELPDAERFADDAIIAIEKELGER